MTVKTRFAPSPTGFLHVGGARTALFSWLHARKHGGTFVLRVEDTDRERSTDEAVEAILDGMAWLDLNYDEGPYYQTQRFDRYKQVVQQLIDDGHAYHCYCSKDRLEALREQQMANKEKPRYDGLCRDRSGPAPDGIAPVVRFRNPVDGDVVVNDMIRGRVVFANAELDDLIIARSDGTPVYNLCVVVDDLDMAITHVIRGDDHLNNTPRQMNILKALGASVPEYAHLPMILGADGQKLSKRHGAVSVTQYRDEGYLPEALLNYLVRLGWSHGDQEIFSREEMIALFDAHDVNQSASAFNPSKLIWLNQHYMKTLEPSYVAEHLKPHLIARGLDLAHGPDLAALVVAQRERAKTLVEMADNSVFFFQEFDEYDAKSVAKAFTPEAKVILGAVLARCGDVAKWQASEIHAMVEAVAAEQSVGMGNVAQPLRVAAAGKGVSPPIDITLELMGRERTLQRIQRAIAWIEANVK